MIQTIKNIIKGVARSSAESNPKVYEEDGQIYVRCGSANFANRALYDLRAAGIGCNLLSGNWKIICIYD